MSKLWLAQLIVWNIGQGQWVTEVHPQACLHYDLGGEKNITEKVEKLCRNRPNYLFLSHWDWDHISFAAPYAARVRTSCLVKLPAGTASPHKRRFIEKIPLCRPEQLRQLSSRVKVIYEAFPKPRRTSNELSRVIYSRGFRVLIPGDSPSNQEKTWSSEAPAFTAGLILGHHGSRTSTGLKLLDSLKNLRWAVSSARQRKYGHPHREVIERLEKVKVPLLKTEDWGHLHFGI